MQLPSLTSGHFGLAKPLLSLLLIVCWLLVPRCLQAADQPRTETAATIAKSAPKTVPSSASRAFSRSSPKGVEDLLAIETQVRKIVDKLIAATVSVQLGGTQGSGVIVTREGYVLTAAHVAGSPGRDVTLVLADGKRVDARSLGLNATSDAGLLKITSPGEYPFVEMSDLNGLKIGDWCLAIGHPGGYETDRPPVVRLGRIVVARESFLQTDCTLVGGDSGGPLFDLEGHVIGIHSRIGAPTTLNLHVPVRAFTENWERFARSEQIEAKPAPRKALLGVDGKDDEKGARITAVFPKWPADVAGIQVDDIVLKVDSQVVRNFEEFKKQLSGKSPGDTVKLEFLRNGQPHGRAAILVGYP